jgi:hypothetical protein
MPKSRVRTKRGKTKPTSHSDKKNINEIFAAKMHEYNQLGINSLLEMHRENKVRGRYKEALNLVIIAKQKMRQKEEDAK